MWNAVYEECPQAEYTGIAMEYGTLPLLEVMQAMRADHWLHNHPDAAPELLRSLLRRFADPALLDQVTSPRPA